MVTENIDIIIRERGAVVVKRRLEDIGNVAEKSVRGLRLLQNAIFVLGAAGGISALTRLIDTITNFENRIRLVTNSTQELNAVQRELFDIATRTRGQFESTSEIYTRTALAVRELGISQRETLNFTESLNQAVILSGASVREANAALIQLAQGLASGRLNGDELRSVLEQLPFVADIIAKELGVTRGELRKLGADGKITSDIILTAFRNARDAISQDFADTIPTIGQSLQVLRTSFIRFLANLDDATGLSEAVARAFLSIAENLQFLVGGLAAAAAGFAALRLSQFASSLLASARVSRELTSAVAAGNATLLTSVEVERAKAASSLASAQASAANAASKVREIQVNNAALTQQVALLRQQQASIIIDKQRRVARDALTGRFIAYNAAVAQNIRTNIALLSTERQLTASKSALIAATSAQVAATNTLSAAQTRSAAAGAAAETLTARLSRAFPALSAAVGAVSGALSGFFALIVANPITAIVVGITAAISALFFFSDSITVTSDGVVNLKDVFIATFQLIGEAINSVIPFTEIFEQASQTIATAWSGLKDFFFSLLSSIGQIIKTLVNGYIAIWVGGYNAVIAVWGLLPQAFARLGALAVNSLLTIVDRGIEGIVRGVGDLLEFIGGAFSSVGLDNPFENLLDGFSIDLESLLVDVPESAGNVGEIAAREFLGAFERDFVGEAFGAILERAREIAEQRIADLTTTTGSPRTPGTDGGRGNRVTFEKIVKDLVTQNELLKLNATERERLSAIIDIEEKLKRKLTSTEAELVDQLLRENELLTRAAEIYDAVNGPASDYELTLRALNMLLSEGRIKQEEFTQSVRAARIEFLETQTDLASGFERGFLKILERTGDFASQAEDIVTTAFDGMSQSIADLVVDGEADFGSLIRSINKQIVQLVVSQAFQRLFGDNLFGGGGGDSSGIFGGLFSGLSSLLGLQRGGSFVVNSGSGVAPIPNGGNDNRLVAFRAQDGETVTVTPRGQSSQDSAIYVNTTFNITTSDAESFRRSESQIASRMGIQIRRAVERNGQ